MAPEHEPRTSPSGQITSDPAVLVVRLERDFWRARCEALQRIVSAKAPALAGWFSEQDRAILEKAFSGFPRQGDWQLQFISLIALYRALPPPASLVGRGSKRRGDLFEEPFVLHIHFEEICRALHRHWQPKRGLRTGTNVLMSRHLPAVYRRIALLDNRRPRADQIEAWARERSVDTFAYRLLAHARGMKFSYVRRVISQQRSYRKAGVTKYGLDVLPEHLRNWRSRKGLSSPSARSK